MAYSQLALDMNEFYLWAPGKRTSYVITPWLQPLRGRGIVVWWAPWREPPSLLPPLPWAWEYWWVLSVWVARGLQESKYTKWYNIFSFFSPMQIIMWNFIDSCVGTLLVLAMLHWEAKSIMYCLVQVHFTLLSHRGLTKAWNMQPGLRNYKSNVKMICPLMQFTLAAVWDASSND